MSEIDLFERFPDMTPVSGVPTLGRINGFGLGLYGARDHDAETDTYVTTHCISALFIPVLALGAYRVFNHQGGYLLLGRVPLSTFARTWNILLVVGILGAAGWFSWQSYTSSPEYIAGTKLAQADRLAAAGEAKHAAELYREVALGASGHAAEAMTKLTARALEPEPAVPLGEVVEYAKVVVELRDRPGVRANLFQRGMAVVSGRGNDDPRGAALLLDAFAPAAPKDEDLTAFRLGLLERAAAADPQDVEVASMLAVVYESREQWEKCAKLLAPHRDRLGVTEGARVLGQMLARQGKLDEAHALLVPYTEGRLAQLHLAETALEATLRTASVAVLEQLRTGKVADFNYAKYERSEKADQTAMVLEYINSKLKDNADIKRAQDAVTRASAVVPVAIDLGVVLLRRGQGMADPAARKAELEKAEKMFLAVRGVAGETDQYRLFLGQVYYWLGKHADGRKLFDEMLAAHNRDTMRLVAVGRLLREVGAVGEARPLLEEAYRAEADREKKEDMAVDVALVASELDDKITWLKRGGQDPHVRAMLSNSLGERALRDGKDDEAARHLREAIAQYAKLPVSASSLNNGATAWRALHAVTGETEALDRASEMLEKAHALQPTDSIILINLAASTLEAAMREVIAPTLDLKTLRSSGSTTLLTSLYRDAAGHEQLVSKLRKSPKLAKAVANLNRLQVLAPKGSTAYDGLAAVHEATKDTAALRELKRRLDEVELDLNDEVKRALDYYAGKDDEKTAKDVRAAVARTEAILKAARTKGPGATTAAAIVLVIRGRLGLESAVGGVDLDDTVKLAEEADAMAPSRATAHALQSALLARAHRALGQAEPAYSALAKKARRSVEATYFVPVALSRPGKARDAALANADVRRVVDLVKEGVARLPEDQGAWTWAMLRATAPEDAERVAKQLAGDERERLEVELAQRRSPVSAATALRASWLLEMAGKDAEAAAVLKRCAERGVPLPLAP